MDKPWKKWERDLARMFGTTRKLAKGSSEVSDIGGDNPDFPLVLDGKHRRREDWRVIHWFLKVEEFALPKGKWPVLAIKEPGRGKKRSYAFVRRAPLMHFISEKTLLNADNFFTRMPKPGNTLPFLKHWGLLMRDFKSYKSRHRDGIHIPVLFMLNVKHDVHFAILTPEDLAMIFREGGLIT